MTNESKPKGLRVPYGFSIHGQEEIDAVVNVLKGNTALGDKTKEFEKVVAGMFGKKYGVMVNSGSSANLLALEILNLKPGDEVITPVLTFATTLAPIIQKGLKPVFVDVDRQTFLINLDQLEKAITKKTKVLLIPSLMGNIPDLKRIAAIAKKHKLWFIEDSCDTLGGTFNGRPTGEFSHITTTSFYGSHIVNGAGGGGIVCVNDPKWVDRLVVLRGWGRQSSLFGEKANSELLENRFKQKLAGIPYDAKFIFSEIGYNFLPLEISAAFGLVQLKKFPDAKSKRSKNYDNLNDFFSKKYSKFFDLAIQTPNTETVWLAFPLILKKKVPFTRLELVTFLENNNIQTRPIFTGNVLKQPGFKNLKYRGATKTFPNADDVMANGMVIGSHHGLTTEQIDYMKSKFDEFFDKY